MPYQNKPSRRRDGKLIGFIIAEAAAVTVVLLAGAFLLAARPVDASVIMATNVVMIAAAVGVALIPILFFALAPILPRAK